MAKIQDQDDRNEQVFPALDRADNLQPNWFELIRNLFHVPNPPRTLRVVKNDDWCDQRSLQARNRHKPAACDDGICSLFPRASSRGAVLTRGELQLPGACILREERVQ